MSAAWTTNFRLRDVARAGLPLALARGEKVFDPVCGIVRAVIPNTIEQGDPKIHAFGALTCRTDRLDFNRMAHRMGGASLDRDGAIAATIGEAVERYCAAFYDESEMVFAPHTEVADDAVHPSKFGLFSARQYARPDSLTCRSPRKLR